MKELGVSFIICLIMIYVIYLKVKKDEEIVKVKKL